MHESETHLDKQLKARDIVAERVNLQGQALWLALLAAVIVFILWNIPQLGFLLYPFRLFVTFIHEAGHGLMALFTGGAVDSIVVNSSGSGVARTIGGHRALILPAGYLGSAFFGAALFYLTNKIPFPRKISLVVGTLLILASLFMGARELALVIGVIMGTGLIFVGLRASITVNLLLLNFLAIITGLNAVLDIFSLVRYTGSTLTSGGVVVHNDAAAFTREVTPFISAAVWAVIWAILAITILGLSIWYSVIVPMRRGGE